MNAFSTTTPAADLAPAAPSRDTAAAVAEGVREPVGGNGGAPGASSGGSDYLSPGAALLPADADGSLHNTGMAELASQYGGARLVHFISNGKPARRHCVHAGVARVATGMELYHEVYHIRYGEQASTLSSAGGSNPGLASGVLPPTPTAPNPSGHEHVIMVMGFAAAHDNWLSVIREMLDATPHVVAHGLGGTLELCVFDNRGIGRSTVPAAKTAYTAELLAADALALMDVLSWERAHVVGFSMGAMISTRLAVLAPHRVCSLTLLNTTAGGWQIVPVHWPTFKTLVKGMRDQSVHGRANLDVKFHFSARARRWMLGPHKLGRLLVAEYVRSAEASGRQAPEGEAGHFNVCWGHDVTDADAKAIRQAGFPVLLLHGEHDIVAMPKHAARLAQRLGGEFKLLDGAHFTPRENALQVAGELLKTIFFTANGTHEDGSIDVDAFAAYFDTPLVPRGLPMRRKRPQCLGCCA
mmetsp:Transcript_8499/g.25748  ORF Transcript_8499/g.25748 Transcript_8499/m.25748 type:complete len:468 (-) Transcript_8499:111-1514(-)